MKNINKKTAVFTFLIAIIYIVSCTNKTDKSAVTSLDKNLSNEYSLDAMNNPDKFAWELFIEISRPADPDNPNGETVWQKEWANADDVFADSTKAAVWSEIVGRPLQVENNKAQIIQQKVFNEMLLKMGLTELEIKNLHKTNNCLAVDSLIKGETKMNKATFDFINDNKMFNAEGVEAMFASKTKIDFPIESREIKALWNPIKESEKSKYHFIEKNGIIYGLVSLHLITKDLPNWTWATFEHIDNECLSEVEKNPILKSRDSYGKNSDGSISKELRGDFIKNGMPDKWKNYILRGTQTDFTTSTGENTILANTYTENGFVATSSCITCHARATVGPYLGDGKINHLDIFETRNPLTGNLGSPDPNWFYDYNEDGSKTIKYIQTDFLWSIPFRVKRKSK